MNKATALTALLITLAIGLAGGYWLAQYGTGLMLPGDQAESTGNEQRPDFDKQSLSYQSGPFRFDIQVKPERPVVGSNRLILILANRDNSPITGAEIRAVAEMPAMGAMPAMQAPADMEEVAPGIYEGTFEPSMKGAWPLSIQVHKDGVGKTQFSFDLATGRQGLELAGGASKVAETSAGKGNGYSYQAGPYRFDIDIVPEKPVVGKNTLTLRLANDRGKPITDAKIRAVAEMPAMGAMPAMQAPADMTEVEPGVYRGTFRPSMEGAWPLQLTLEGPDMPARTVGFDMATGRAGLEPSTGVTEIKAGQVVTEEAPPGTITVDARRRQLIGVTFAEAKQRSLTRSIRAVGQVAYDEIRVADVSLKYDAWIGELKADFVGAQIEKGQLLFTVYSPELYSAQQEYLDILRRGHETLLTAARQRLSFWDMGPASIEALEKRGKPFEYIPIFAPRSGTLVEKNIVAGTSHKSGAMLMRIADLSRVWVEAELYENELPLIAKDTAAIVTLPYLPGERFEGRIDYVYPYLNKRSRTGRVRLSLPNEHGLLKPDMYAEVKLEIPLGERLSVPEDAVLVAGETRVVFEDLGDGRLAPRRVKTGRRVDGYIEILEGLEPGDRVVTSGNFLIASESKLKSGIKQW